jgi:hypothetical protein
MLFSPSNQATEPHSPLMGAANGWQPNQLFQTASLPNGATSIDAGSQILPLPSSPSPLTDINGFDTLFSVNQGDSQTPAIIDPNQIAAAIPDSGDPILGNAPLSAPANIPAGERANWMSGKYGVMVAMNPGDNGWAGKFSTRDVLYQDDKPVIEIIEGKEVIKKERVEATVGAWADSVKKFVDSGGIDQLVNDIQLTGASYAVFNVGSPAGFYFSPNQVLDDRLANYRGFIASEQQLKADAKGEYTPDKTLDEIDSTADGVPDYKYDVVKQLGNRLHNLGIKLLVYINAEGPSGGTAEIVEATQTTANAGIDEFHSIYPAMVSAWSNNWQGSVDGWWIDGGWVEGYQQGQTGSERNIDPNNRINTLISSARAGNPNAVVTVNPVSDNFNMNFRKNIDDSRGTNNVFTATENVVSPYQDFLAGEMWHWLWRYPEAGSGGKVQYNGNNIQWHTTGYLGADDKLADGKNPGSWIGQGWNNPSLKQIYGDGAGENTFTPREIATYIRNVTSRGGAVTLAIPVLPSGKLASDGLGLMREANRLLTPEGERDLRPGGPNADLALYQITRMLANTDDTAPLQDLEINSRVNMPSMGVDGNDKTIALPGGVDTWNYQLEFDRPTTFSEVEVLFPTKADKDKFTVDAYPGDFVIETSNDGKQWTVFDERRNGAVGGGLQVFRDAPIEARYVRVKSESNAPGIGGMGIASLRIFNR